MKHIQLYREFTYLSEHKNLSPFSNTIVEGWDKNGVQLIQADDRRPLEKLLTCQFTMDGKSVI